MTLYRNVKALLLLKYIFLWVKISIDIPGKQTRNQRDVDSVRAKYFERVIETPLDPEFMGNFLYFSFPNETFLVFYFYFLKLLWLSIPFHKQRRNYSHSLSLANFHLVSSIY